MTFFKCNPVTGEEAMHRADRERGTVFALQHGCELGKRDVCPRIDCTEDHLPECLDAV